MIPDALEDAWNGEVGIYEKVSKLLSSCFALSEQFTHLAPGAHLWRHMLLSWDGD